MPGEPEAEVESFGETVHAQAGVSLSICYSQSNRGGEGRRRKEGAFDCLSVRGQGLEQIAVGFHKSQDLQHPKQ